MSEKQSVTFRAPAELVARLKRLAEQNQRSLSGEVVYALTQHVDSNGGNGVMWSGRTNVGDLVLPPDSTEDQIDDALRAASPRPNY